MRILSTVAQMKRLSERSRLSGRRIGFVPTMGALHAGHLSLIRIARKEADLVVVSIFVNPTQFGPSEDFEAYPRDLRHDRESCRRAGADVLFTPSRSEMYPGGYSTSVSTGRLTDRLCGPFRPGHFQGVTTVLTKLFNIVRPHIAVFGQKDYQQSVVIKQLVTDLNLDVGIITGPTIREPDGLAMSSRNSYLSPRERRAARVLYRSLLAGRQSISKGQRDPEKIKARIRDRLKREPLVRLEYLSICHPDNLEESKRIKGKTLIALAARIGPTRLIDNILV